MYGMVCLDFRAKLKFAESLNPKEPVINLLTDSLIDEMHSLLFCSFLSCVLLSTIADRCTSIALLAQDEYGLHIGTNIS